MSWSIAVCFVSALPLASINASSRGRREFLNDFAAFWVREVKQTVNNEGVNYDGQENLNV